MNTLIVCGGRDFCDVIFAKNCIEQAITEFELMKSTTVIMSGGAQGADTLALEWARANEWNAMRVPAKWNDMGKSAGMARNMEMLELAVRMHAEGSEVIVLALPGGVGTSGMVAYTKRYMRYRPFISVVDRR